MENFEFIQYIANNGLGVLMTIILLYMLYKENKQRESDNKETRQTLTELKDVIKDNTNLLQRLLDTWK